ATAPIEIGAMPIFVSSAARTNGAGVPCTVGRVLLRPAHSWPASSDRWFLDRSADRISMGARDCICTSIRVVAARERRHHAQGAPSARAVLVTPMQSRNADSDAPDETQRKAARVVGAAYLCAL